MQEGPSSRAVHPLTIEHVAPETLMRAPYNPRMMDDDARDRLRRSVAEFGLVDPIIARRSDRLVIGGHQRLDAALFLGLDPIPVVFLDGINDDRAAALNVALNNPHAQGEWDMAKLSGLLSELDGRGFDATLTAFSEPEIEKMLTWTADAEPDIAPALGEVQFQLVVTCANEHEQANLCAELEARGFSCRPLML